MTDNKTLPDPRKLLALEIESETEKLTLQEYLIGILDLMWTYPRGFDATKPYGYEGWKDEVVHAFILNGHLEGRLDNDGGVVDYNSTQFKELMDSVFSLLNSADPASFTLPPEPKEWYLISFDVTNPEKPYIDGFWDDEPYTEAEAKEKSRPRHEAWAGSYIEIRAVHIPA